MLPPMVVFKQLNGSLYPAWCREGPTGSVYAATTSGWFDHTTFAQWFESVRTYTYLPTYPYLPVPVRYLGRYLPTYGTRYLPYLPTRYRYLPTVGRYVPVPGTGTYLVPVPDTRYRRYR
jgi:hypothetical protein